MPHLDVDLMYRGQVLQNENTIGFYGVQTDDLIVALPRNAPPDITQRWMRVAVDNEAFEDRLKLATNPQAKAEQLRLRDLIIMKQELKRRADRNAIARMVWLTDAFTPATPPTPTIIPEPAVEISTEPLPMLFGC
jgi:hypothetical protein